MEIAIIGSGALGLFYGSLLEKNKDTTNISVHFLLRSDYEYVKQNGLKIKSIKGDFNLKNVSAYNNPEDMPKCDLIIIGLKTTSNSNYEKLIRPLFEKNKTIILPLQNGIGNEDTLAEIFPANQILGGVAFLCSNRTGAGEIHHSDYGHIGIAPYKDDFIFDVERIRKLFLNSEIECTTNSNYIQMRWQKQLWNVPFNGLCTLYNQATNYIMERPKEVEKVKRIMQEIVALSSKLNLQISPHKKFTLNEKSIDDMITKTRTMGAYLPSMLIDFREGKEMEIDSIITSCITQRDKYAIDVELPEIEKLNKGLLKLS